MCGDVPGGPREWLRYEISCNAVLAGAPLSVLCGIDTTELPDQLVSLAVDAHPQLAVGDVVVDNRRFREPSSYLRALPVPREPVEDMAPLLAVDRAMVLPELRR